MGAFRPISLILQCMKNTYVFFKYKASFLTNFVNRDELYWAKHFKNQTIWQNPHLKKLLSLIHFSIEMGYTERNALKSNNLSEPAFAKSCFFESLLSIEMSYTERNALKIKLFGRWPIWKSFFHNPFCQSRWAILSETLQKPNNLTEPVFEKKCFF